MDTASVAVRAVIPLAFMKNVGSRTTPVGVQMSFRRSSKKPPT